MTAMAGLAARRSGPGHWWKGFWAMLRWEVTGMRLLLPLTIIVQILLGAGFVLGIGLLFEDIPARAAVFLSTGATVVTLITVGLVLGPQLVVQQRLSGTYDYLWSLPVPRSASAAAWLVLNALIAVPGMWVALLAAAWRYDIDFTVTAAVVPAVLTTLAAGTLLGYALAHAVPKPELVQLLTQVLIFVVVGFAPINFPPENLPTWLADLHEYLPFVHMARVVRASLVEGLVGGVGRSYLVLGVWTAVATGIVVWALGRRR